MDYKEFSKKLEKVIRKVCNKKSELHLHEPIFSNLEKRNVLECIESSFVSTNGKKVEIFENLLKKKFKSKYVLATNSGTSALHLCYLVLGINKNDEILIPTLNYIASANAAKYVGAIPHFVDVEKETLGIDVDKLDRYLKKICIKKGSYFFNKKTNKKITAVIPTHLYGSISNMSGLKSLAKKYNLDLIEDAAEAIGADLNGIYAGTFGRMGVLSFNGNKTITTGSGGAIFFKNKKDYERAKVLANVGKIKVGNRIYFKTLGFNYKMNNIQAALGIAQLNKLNYILKLKKKINKKYTNEFSKSLPSDLFQRKNKIGYNFWLNVLLLNTNLTPNKNKIVELLITKKINVRSSWELLHKVNFFKDNPKMDLKSSEILYEKIINLPSSPKYAI